MEENNNQNEEIDQLNYAISHDLAKNSAYDDISLQEKTIEPYRDDHYTEHINRNLQLGNLSHYEYVEIMNEYILATKYLDIPDEGGGVDFGHGKGHTIIKRANMKAVLSNSKEGVARQGLSERRIVTSTNKEPKRSNWMGKKNEN